MPEVSETTGVKGQFGLGQSDGTGKKLKIIIFILQMSVFWKPPLYGVSGREVQWLNNTAQAHDMFCGCDEPFQHFIYSFAKRSHNYGITTENLRSMQKCLTTTEEKGTQTDTSTDTDDDTGGPEGDLTTGELEKLFAEDGDFTENHTG